MNRVLGTTEDYNGCDCCGRENLKVYVVIDHGTHDGHYGTTCAANLLAKPATEIRAEARRADQAKRAEANRAANAAKQAETEVWLAWLADNGEGTETIDQIRSLGGMATARKLYAEAV